jgi:hypothetical protein
MTQNVRTPPPWTYPGNPYPPPPVPPAHPAAQSPGQKPPRRFRRGTVAAIAAAALVAGAACDLAGQTSLPQLAAVLAEARQQGTTMLLVEQNANIALTTAQFGYVLEVGRIVMEDTCERLLQKEDIREFYLGLRPEGTARSFRDVKHYKRRKRWLS